MPIREAELRAVLAAALKQTDEDEVLEFKEARRSYDLDKLGVYYSALANEANLNGRPWAWLIFGIEDRTHRIVGTGFRSDPGRLQALKHELAQNLSDGQTFLGIHELTVEGKRVLLFQIPAAPAGRPCTYKGFAYCRQGESTVALSLEKSDRIRGFANLDWSAQIVPEATVADLDPAAVQNARERYLACHPELADECRAWDAAKFLNKAGLLRQDRVTNAAVLLLGRAEAASLIGSGGLIRWTLRDARREELDFQVFGLPLLLAEDQALAKIRNLQLRELYKGTMTATERLTYEPFTLREALNNCLAHQDYRQGGCIDIVEYEHDRLVFSNCGTFLPGSVREVVLADAPPKDYRNPFLVAAMRNLGLVDERGGGICRMFRHQIDRAFPLPRYDLRHGEVNLTIYGRAADPRFAQALRSNPGMSLEEVLALDDELARSPLPGAAAEPHDDLEEALLRYLGSHRGTSRADIDAALAPALPAELNSTQRRAKVTYLLNRLRQSGLIATFGRNRGIRYSLRKETAALETEFSSRP